MGISEKPRQGSGPGESPTSEGSQILGPEHANALEQSASHELSGDELTDRLRLESPDLIEEISKIAKEQLASEIGREAALNGKATALLTSSGLALTVAFTF